MPGTKKTAKPKVRAVGPSARTAKTVLSSARAARATARVIVKPRLTPAEHAQLDRIAQAHAARMAAEFKDLFEVMSNVERVEPSLGGRRDGGPAGIPDLSGLPGGSSQGSGSQRDDRHAFMPSMDLSSYMAGAASGDATVTKDPETGIVEKTWTTENEDGTSTVHTSAHNPQEGSSTSTHTTRSGGREVHHIRITDRRDGSSEGETRVTDADGRTTHTWERDSRGNLVVDFFQTTDRRGRVVEEWDRARVPRGGLNRMPTDDATSELGRALGARFSHGAKKPGFSGPLVNPGDPDLSGPEAPRLNPGDSIVVNPAGEAAGQGREVSAARARHWQQQLRDRVGGLVNPPGPSDRKD